MRSVNEVARLCGISRRTLQYYDQIGLLPPSAIKESGYRQYDEDALLRLWLILLYRELDLPLAGIRVLLTGSKEDEKRLMAAHRQAIAEKAAHLRRVMKSIEGILNGHFDINMLKDFDKSKIESIKAKYAQEMKNRSQERNPFQSFFRPLVGYRLRSGKAFDAGTILGQAQRVRRTDWKELRRRGEEVAQMFRAAVKSGPESAKAKRAAMAFRQFVSALMPCSDATLRTIGQAYKSEKAEIDPNMPGLAGFVSEAIQNAIG